MAYLEATTEQRRKFTLELAAALGEGWIADVDSSGEYVHCGVRHKDGYGVHVHHETAWHGKPMRIRLSGIWPVDNQRQMHVPGNGSAHSITVAADKAVCKVAGDIKNRFLPIYLEQYAKCKERADGSTAYETATQRTIAELKEQIHGRTAQHSAGGFYPERSHVYQVTAQGDSVRFEAFSCPVEVAIVLLKVARKVETFS
jgi:hypothetical protein